MISLPVIRLEGLNESAVEYAKKLKSSSRRYSSIPDIDLEKICIGVEGRIFASVGVPPTNLKHLYIPGCPPSGLRPTGTMSTLLISGKVCQHFKETGFHHNKILQTNNDTPPG